MKHRRLGTIQKKKKSEPVRYPETCTGYAYRVIASADRQGKSHIMHFGKPKKEAIQQGALNIDGPKLLDNVGGEVFDYGSSKALYDTDAPVKTMTANFNQR